MTARAAADFVSGKSTAGAISISAMALAQEVLNSHAVPQAEARPYSPCCSSGRLPAARPALARHRDVRLESLTYGKSPPPPMARAKAALAECS